MLNYMKSEWYRIVRSATMHAFAGILAGLTLLYNIILFLCDKYDASFPYGTVSFSLSMLASGMTIFFFVGMIIVSLLFVGDKKNGILKNAVSFGISREKIFLGKCIISTVVSICSLLVILVVYLGSAVLLLEPGVEPMAVFVLLKGIGYMLLMAIAFEVLGIALCSFFEKEMPAYLVWYLIMAGVPWICRIIGLKLEFFRTIAAWMPYNYLDSEVLVNMSGWSCLWDTSQGAAKCLISGGIGLVAFLIIGLRLSKKQEV